MMVSMKLIMKRMMMTTTAAAVFAGTAAFAIQPSANAAATTAISNTQLSTVQVASVNSVNDAAILKVIKLVNQKRVQAGLKPLSVNTNLQKVAQVKANDMAQNGYFDHTSPTYGTPFKMMKTYGITYTYAGENIAKGQSSAAEVMSDWMNSPGHKANILNKNFTQIGVGLKNGVWVQEFIRK